MMVTQESALGRILFDLGMVALMLVIFLGKIAL